MLTIIDYGVGNLASIRNMLKKAGVPARISSSREEVAGAEKLILPGVGAFDSCVQALNESGLRDTLEQKVIGDKTPVLGICVGMQLLLEGSEEGSLPGLGWIKGHNVRFRLDAASGYKVPHMGWTEVSPAQHTPLLDGLDEHSRFYFVHSYHAEPARQDDVLLRADYGYNFAAAIGRDNIAGVQFHPEKSHRFGMQLLSNFGKKENS